MALPYELIPLFLGTVKGVAALLRPIPEFRVHIVQDKIIIGILIQLTSVDVVRIQGHVCDPRCIHMHDSPRERCSFFPYHTTLSSQPRFPEELRASDKDLLTKK